jgi:hypothetical protein
MQERVAIVAFLYKCPATPHQLMVMRDKLFEIMKISGKPMALHNEVLGIADDHIWSIGKQWAGFIPLIALFPERVATLAARFPAC